MFRPGILFSPTNFDNLSMEGSVGNPIGLDEEENMENAPPPAPSTRESVRPTEHARLERICAFRAGIENVPDSVSGNLLQ